MLKKIDLFEADTHGYATYRIPGVAVTKRGSILAYCAARKSGIDDWANIDIALRRCVDGGDSWEPQRIIVEEGTSTADNPVAIIDRETEAVHFLYQTDYSRCFYMRSLDEGETFSTPVEITDVFEEFREEYDWNVIAPGPGHGIQLETGRLLVPVWLSTGGEAHRPSCVSTIYSDDHGATWSRGEIVTFNGASTPAGQSVINPSETVAAQLSDGRVMLNIRSESMPERRLVSYSDNGATGWSPPEFDEGLFDSVCMAGLLRLMCQRSDTDDLLLFVNPDNGDNVRKNLTLKLSYDAGKSWPVAKTLEPDIAAYPDLAEGHDGTLYCLYERGGIDGNMFHTRYLTLARFDLDWLLQ